VINLLLTELHASPLKIFMPDHQGPKFLKRSRMFSGIARLAAGHYVEFLATPFVLRDKMVSGKVFIGELTAAIKASVGVNQHRFKTQSALHERATVAETDDRTLVPFTEGALPAIIRL
jgi:hypothetical protein